MSLEANHQTALRLSLDSGPCSLALTRIHHVTGPATLTGAADDYFLGWLTFRGQLCPVFDLNQVVCEKPTPISFGTRIILVDAGAGAPVPYVGLLAADVTDTVAANDPSAPPLDLDLYLSMLLALVPAGAA